MKKLVSLLLAVCLILGSVPVLANGTASNYEMRDGRKILRKYNGNNSEYYVMPDVKEIDEFAFSNRISLRRIVISPSVEVIHKNAFHMCSSLYEIVIPKTVAKIHPGGFSNCVIGKVVISEGIEEIERQSFSGCNIGTLVVLNKNTKMYTRAWHSYDMNGTIKQYYEPGSFDHCGIGEIIAPLGSEAQKYATEYNIKFTTLDEKTADYYTEDEIIEVEPVVQSIHGGLIHKNMLVDRVKKIAEANGGNVLIAGDNIVVKKNGKDLLIAGDKVHYKENGKLITESLKEPHSDYLKMPEKALESVLGEDNRKSEKYKAALASYNGNIIHAYGTIETPYGSVVEHFAAGVMRAYSNDLNFIKWNGENISITTREFAPYSKPWSAARWKKIELSENGKILTVTYPENKKKREFYFSDTPTILWDEGTYIITVNLETGEVKRTIEPVKKEEPKVEQPKVEKPQKTYDELEKENKYAVYKKDGMTVTTSILEEPKNGPKNLFDGDFVSYCVITTRNEANPEYIQFDLGEVKEIKKLGLAFKLGDMRTTYFDIRVSTDGINYETVVPKRGNEPNNDLQYFDINKKAQYIRMYGYSNSMNKYWISITEADVVVK